MPTQQRGGSAFMARRTTSPIFAGGGFAVAEKRIQAT
jgi:hypothetical protein